MAEGRAVGRRSHGVFLGLVWFLWRILVNQCINGVVFRLQNATIVRIEKQINNGYLKLRAEALAFSDDSTLS